MPAEYSELKPLGDPVVTPRSSDGVTDLESQPLKPSPRTPGSLAARESRRHCTDRKSIQIPELQIEAERMELDEDVYSAVLFTLTSDMSEMLIHTDTDGLDRRVNVYRFCYTLMLLGVNYALQIGLIVWVFMYVAAPALHRAQNMYQRYHSEVFLHGKFQQDLWENWDIKDPLCRIAFSNYWFLYAILSLWWIAMVTEVNKTYQVFTKINALGHTDDPSQMIVRLYKDGESENLLWKLLSSVRIAIVVIIFVPKLAIAAGLWWVGTLWLASTDSFENLVLNSVALTFIINIDEQIFIGLIPATMKKNISITKLVRGVGEEPDDKEHEDSVKAAYRSATIHFAVVVFGVALYLSAYGQGIPYIGVFPGYARGDDFACPKFWDRERNPICMNGKDCFPIS